MPRKRSSRSQPSAQQVKIIGGSHRGRVLRFPAATPVRPTLARVRETAFNWLMLDIPGATVLDLFAGTGVLGFESLSRGAAHVDMVERDPALVTALRANADQLGLSASVTIAQQTADHWLAQQAERKARYDVIWLDPPFDEMDQAAVDQICDTLAPLLKPGGVCYLEQPKQRAIGRLNQPPFALVKHKITADVQTGIWRQRAL